MKKILTIEDSASLSQRTAKSSLWLVIFRVFDQVFRLIRTIILARLLSPVDFGLFGITLMAVSLLDTFSQSGFHHAMVHKKQDIGSYLNTSFVVQIVRGIFLALILFISAPYISLFFNVPGSEAILRVMCLAILIQGMTNVAVVYLSKELKFQKYFLYQISGTIADLLVSVFLAIVMRNVWALVYGFLAGAIVRCVISYFVYFYIPRFKFDFSKAKELFSYGKWVFGSNIVGFFMSQIDSFFIAKISGVVSLGFYQIAYKVPSILGMEVLAGATFPAYAKIQDDKQKLKEAYLKTTKIFSFILLPIAGGVFVVATDFIKLFLGANWLPSLWPMRILTLSTLVWTMAVVSDYLFLAVGKPNIQVRWTSIKLVVMLVFLYPLILKFGLSGASLVVLIGSLIAASGLVFEALNIIKCRFAELFNIIFSSFSNALIMSFLVYFLRFFLPDGFLSFILVVFSGVIIYLLLTIISDKIFDNKMIELLKESLKLLS